MSEKATVPFKKGLFQFPAASGEEPYLIGVHCHSCGKKSFPSRPICIFCHSKDVREIPLSRRGILHTFTICRVPVPFTNPPYAIGFIDLPEGVRVFSQFTGWVEKDLKIGMEMELVVERLKTDAAGNEIISYKFRPKG